MTTISLTPQVIDYLVAACRASTQLGAASPPVNVHDGPQTTADSMAENRHLWIGGVPLEQPVTATAGQDFSFIDHARTRDEKGEIQCAAWAWGGSTDLKTHRDACHAIVGTVELMLRGDPASGGPGDASLGGLVFWAHTTGPFEWTPRQTGDGAQVMCLFKISYFGRVTTS